MNNIRPISDPSIASAMLTSLQLLDIVRPAKIDCSRPQIDPADVPACMRPDCMPPANPIPEVRHEEAADRLEQIATTDGSGSCVSAGHGAPGADDARADDAAADAGRSEVTEHGRGGATVAHPSRAAAGSNPAPGQPAKPPSWIEQRHARINGAIAFLKSRAILVTVVDRDAQIRQYFVSGNRNRLFAEEVIEIAIEKGWAE